MGESIEHNGKNPSYFAQLIELLKMENEKVINLTKQYNDLQNTLDKNLGPLTEELRYFVLLEERKNEIIKEKLNSIQKKKLLFMADYLYDIKKVMEENKIISEEALLRLNNVCKHISEV